ncbi:enoyl-CoA hydratase [Amycolatopsis mediterranei S699]|uniref:Enoyl-CoA hydratase n=2 Tax=Amycolatopsis mediterranei TaxID=33910 RepID=A0A0H3DFN8_AMYMU|nr:enoyl-CoA hydratase/isomerase family protein [Amycolatopsis mediterranei]ADJ48918.1 enoyl-CoA hydratase [Amycolatopsis mediterranei U32]AEK45867.1 enoyl-CoA hydratase [Amycolatopsis mediterranei S699]AFO80626.1 enoyl-CoA hydratase [Amycolatopsis mediterranei S699]AGT87754.1 enoyl-CoA hydratase [Amycolatopsis mediterranei RB]KDU93964.1 enoyl-CoA hydratase [Amycolatopsis mediterranei]
METVLFDVTRHVATITLNRPEAMNSFNQAMLDDFAGIWRTVKADDDVHVVVLRAAGERAFSTGMDVKEGIDRRSNVWSQTDPGEQLSPKLNQVWKPLVCAVHGMVAGGAFYWLNEADVIICSDDATFFDPHVSYGLTAALEPIGLARRIPLGEALRIALLGLDERLSPERALQIGLVSEVLPRAELWDRADEIARVIAAKPPAAIQGTVRAIWESLDATRTQALRTGLSYTQLGNPLGKAEVDRASVPRGQWKLR